MRKRLIKSKSVRIALILTALNDFDVKTGDIMNA